MGFFENFAKQEREKDAQEHIRRIQEDYAQELENEAIVPEPTIWKLSVSVMHNQEYQHLITNGDAFKWIDTQTLRGMRNKGEVIG